MPPEPVDLLIEARWVLPIAPVNTVFTDHAVAVTSGKIVALGPIAQMNERFEARERVVRRDHALLPGFVNAHTRAAMTLFRGLPVRGPRSRWVRDTVRPVEQRCMRADFVREGTQLAIAEMLRAGITSFASTNLFPEEAARVASAARMRAAIGLPVADSPNVWADSATTHFERAEQLWDEYKSDPWVCLYFAPQDAAEVSDDTLIRVRRVADELDARIAMESPPLQRLHALGLLRPGFAAIPQDAWNDAESELVATTGICVIACLQSDLRLGGGTPSSVSKLVGQTVGLGSGDPASVGAIDLLAEARVAALLGAGSVSAADALRLATLGGATALGFGADTGSIEPGKYADLVCVDLNRLACQPTSNVPESILFGATREQVSDVWTSGRVAVSGGHLLAFDEQELMASAQNWLARLG
ncbi:MAG: 5-methylthioadenosine/S-adenosylhomocysteine deaminase [Gammaproteobacteria bacterium]|jgi:5-methylthioadenosine/S-adenosylhomocysteine deaminase|nr:5-methylthioadenosine/S-adenosylhomocysteine deaminase [Gammaproteobacteria bacterium]